MDRASDSGSEDCGFESRRARQEIVLSNFTIKNYKANVQRGGFQNEQTLKHAFRRSKK